MQTKWYLLSFDVSTCWNCCFICFHSSTIWFCSTSLFICCLSRSLTISLNSFTSAAKLNMSSGVSCSLGRSDSSSSPSLGCLDFSLWQNAKKRETEGHTDGGNLIRTLKHFDAKTLHCYRESYCQNSNRPIYSCPFCELIVER